MVTGRPGVAPDLLPAYCGLCPSLSWEGPRPTAASFIAAVPGRFCPRSCCSPCMRGPLGLQSSGRLCPKPAVDVVGSPWKSGAESVL